MNKLLSFFKIDFIAKAIRFAGVGLIGSAIYAGLAFGSVVAGLDILFAHTIALTISLLASYVGQKIFTFGVRGGHQRTGPRFAIATAGLVSVQYLLVLGFQAVGPSDYVTLWVSTLFYPPASFLIHTFWTFKAKNRVGDERSKSSV